MILNVIKCELHLNIILLVFYSDLYSYTTKVIQIKLIFDLGCQIKGFTTSIENLLRKLSSMLLNI